ncbi:hypothetical protein TNCV_1811921 [Trichonephila clavipes]|uniref:WAP domain-containing protein n=1 Tax=Trichonephila clavipes TaxID=2585209 RepID=A0A8X7BGL5_TRICX|nr:hypothetical protein TNCV_1811921 [Trichonephila clavipes]
MVDICHSSRQNNATKIQLQFLLATGEVSQAKKSEVDFTRMEYTHISQCRAERLMSPTPLLFSSFVTLHQEWNSITQSLIASLIAFLVNRRSRVCPLVSLVGCPEELRVDCCSSSECPKKEVCCLLSCSVSCIKPEPGNGTEYEIEIDEKECESLKHPTEPPSFPKE